MAGEYHHSHNPCALATEEQFPAKIWELLRRNSHFQCCARKLAEMGNRHATVEAEHLHGPIWERTRRLIERVGRPNVFAGDALEWLTPEPLFIFHTRRRTGYAITPAPLRDSRAWRWVDSKSEDSNPPPLRRGPRIEWWSNDKVNPLEEWQAYAATGKVFSPDCGWADAPPGFKRAFQFLWRSRYDSRALNPITGIRSDSSHLHEVNLQEITDPVVMTLTLAELRKDYRLFAIPRTVLTKNGAKSLCRELSEMLQAELPHDSSMFGSDRQWDDFLSVQDLMNRNDWSLKAAIQQILKDSYLPAASGRAIHDKTRREGREPTEHERRQIHGQTFRRIRQCHEMDVTTRVNFLASLIGKMFPTFSLENLRRPMANRRKRTNNPKP